MKIPEGLFTLSKWDLIYGIINAFGAALIFSILALGVIVNQAGFSLFSIDWKMVIDVAFKAGFAAFVGHISSSFITDKKGVVAGVIPTR